MLSAASSCYPDGWSSKHERLRERRAQDIFGALAQYSTVPASRSSTLPILAAVFAGLLAARIILAGVGLARRKA